MPIIPVPPPKKAKIEVNPEYHSIRIRSPGQYDPKSFRVITFDRGIKATVACPKGRFAQGRCQVGTQVQKLLFPKHRYTKEEAKTWLKKHPKIRLRKKKK